MQDCERTIVTGGRYLLQRKVEVEGGGEGDGRIPSHLYVFERLMLAIQARIGNWV